MLPSGKRQTELSQTAQLMFAEDFAGRILPFDETAAIALHYPAIGVWVISPEQLDHLNRVSFT